MGILSLENAVGLGIVGMRVRIIITHKGDEIRPPSA